MTLEFKYPVEILSPFRFQGEIPHPWFDIEGMSSLDQVAVRGMSYLMRNHKLLVYFCVKETNFGLPGEISKSLLD